MILLHDFRTVVVDCLWTLRVVIEGVVILSNLNSRSALGFTSLFGNKLWFVTQSIIPNDSYLNRHID